MDNTNLYCVWIRHGDPDLPKDFDGVISFISDIDFEILSNDILWNDYSENRFLSKV